MQPYYTQMQRLFENYKSTGKDESPESITFTGNEVDISDFGINSTDITGYFFFFHLTTYIYKTVFF